MTDTTNRTTKTQAAEFARNLSRLDDGERARLKRNAGKTVAESRQVQLLFYQKVLPRDAAPWDEARYFLVATLYPLDKEQRRRDKEAAGREGGAAPAAERSRGQSLGSSFRSIRTTDNERGLDTQFARLLDANEDQLPFLLGQSIKRLVSVGGRVHINWAQLTEDVLAWTHPDRYVQRRWARDYVTYQQTEENKNTQTA